MKRITPVLLAVALLAGLPESPAAQREQRRMSYREVSQLEKSIQNAFTTAQECLERKNYSCATKNLDAIRRQIERLDENWRKDERFLTYAFMTYTQLGLYIEAEKTFNDMPAVLQDENSPQMEAMKDSYGTIAIASDDPLTNDPTLPVSHLRVYPQRGTPREFPLSLVRQRAEEAIRQAFESRDLLTNPIPLPCGDYRLEFSLGTESGLNYDEPDVQSSFSVTAGEATRVEVNPKRSKPALKVLAGLAAILITPILLVN